MSKASLSTWLHGWAGLVLSPLAWALHHQAGSDLIDADCHRVGNVIPVLIGCLALAVTIIGAFLSLGAWRSEHAEIEGSPVRFLAALSLMASGLFGLTIGVQILAAILLPACYR